LKGVLLVCSRQMRRRSVPLVMCVLFSALAIIIFVVQWIHTTPRWEPRYDSPTVATQVSYPV
jgi:hypothetical protein